jgi:nucleotide-binding universal stress UspA family protein
MFAAFNRILVALDGHQGGDDAAALADRLAGAESELATEPMPSAHTHVAARVRELVAEHDADLLVVGAHHRHLSLWPRDYTRAELRDLPCAVAVAPWQYAERPLEPIRTVGVGYVDDRGGRDVLDVARTVAWQLGADVQARTVVAPSNWAAADSGAGWRAVAAGRRMAEIPGVHGAAVEGEPRHALAELSEDVDLLVVGSRHHGVLRSLLPGDVVEGLSRKSRCPLLVVPRRPTD